MKIKVTIGVCLRNCEKEVEKIIDRLAEQDFPHENMEIIFVEDGSFDGTLSSILKNASKLDIKHKILPQVWRGLGYSRNLVSKHSQGKYIVWVDDGTLVPKDYIKKQIEFMDKNPKVGIVRGTIGLYVGSSHVASLENMGQLVFSHKYAGKNETKLPGAGGSVYRAKAVKQVRGFDENIKGATEDSDIVYRILLAGWQIYITPIKFSINYDESFRKIWRKNLWYGHGTHYFIHKHKFFGDMAYRITPLAGFLQGIFVSFSAYKLTRKKTAFLLPIYTSIKMSAFFWGFINSHLESYGHNRESVLR